MTFAEPQILWLLLIFAAPLCVFLFWSWRAKQKLITQFIQSRLLANLTVGVSRSRQKARLALLALAVVFLILAMARPQWGFSLEESRQQGLDIVVAIDTSRSMLAADLQPDRLTRAKLAALDLMQLAKSDRLGVVAFAGSAFLQCPLTLDEEAFRQSINALDVGIIPQGGTALAEAIQTALTAFDKGNDNHKVLVLFTDGEDQDNRAEKAAEEAAKDGLKIFTIGVGTASGELIRLTDDQGNVTFLKDDAGNVVKSRLNETLLRKIANDANGFYLPLQGANPMQVLYARGLAPLPKSDAKTHLIRQARDRFQWPLGIAILLLLLEQFLPHQKRGQREAVNVAAVAKTAALLLFFATFPAAASPSSALKQYESGNFHTALEEFKKLAREKTNDFRLSYNAGTAAYKAKQFDDAQKFLGAATAAPDLNLQQQAFYNLGNTMFETGAQAQEPDTKQKAWESSVQNFQNALKLNPQDNDAKNNLEFVKKQLEELKKQQQQQQKQQQNKNDKNKDQNKDQQNQQQDQNQKNQQKKDQQQNKDESSKQQDQNQNSADQKKDEEQKSQEQKQSEQQKQEQQKKEQQQQNDQKPDDKKPQPEPQPGPGYGRMTAEQALQFLDMQKQDDKPLIFTPTNTVNRKLKDW
jgi:Ca-activated chloride channel family protein